MSLRCSTNWVFISHKTAFFIVTAAKTSDLTQFVFSFLSTNISSVAHSRLHLIEICYLLLDRNVCSVPVTLGRVNDFPWIIIRSCHHYLCRLLWSLPTCISLVISHAPFPVLSLGHNPSISSSDHILSCMVTDNHSVRNLPSSRLLSKI
jgi:hypothetical protein